MRHRFSSVYAFVPALLLLASCAPKFDEGMLRNTQDLARQTDELVAKAGEPFASHATEAANLRSALQAASGAAHAAAHNKLVARNWEIMNDPARGLAFGTLRRWQAESTLHAAFIAARRKDIAEAFSYMVCLEKNKQPPPTPCAKPPAAEGGNQ